MNISTCAKCQRKVEQHEGAQPNAQGLLLLCVWHQRGWAELILPCVHTGMSGVAMDTRAEPDQGERRCSWQRNDSRHERGSERFLGMLLRGLCLGKARDVSVGCGRREVLWKQEPACLCGWAPRINLPSFLHSLRNDSGCVSRQRHQRRL